MAWYLYQGVNFYGPGFIPAEEPEGKGPINFGGVGSFTPVNPRAIPRVFRQRAPHKAGIGDITLVDGSVAVNQRFKDLVERFELDMHLFVPIRLERSNGDLIDGDWYFFAIQQDVDCILTTLDEQSHFVETYAGGWRYSLGGLAPTSSRKLYMSLPAVAGKHLWTAGLLGCDDAFVSDEFAEAYRKSRFRSVLSLDSKVEIVDEVWVADEQMGPYLPNWQQFEASSRTDRSAW